MSNPKLLMLDEPSLGLMPKLVDEMLEAVAKLKEAGKTIYSLSRMFGNPLNYPTVAMSFKLDELSTMERARNY